MPVGFSFALRSGGALFAACVALAGAPAAAASKPPVDHLLGAVSSPYLLAPARIGALYGTVTSGFRSAEHNRRVGGVFNSYHLQGRAIDVQRRPGVTHAMIDAALRRAGFNLIESLDEVDHSHFAFGDVAATRYSRAVPSVAAVTAPPVAAPKPAEPSLLADVHGSLVIDDRHGQANEGSAGVP
ncbi:MULTISPECIES: D-Ala-D-Ala carboxypeptidase family metallohydrolase [Sphingomonas]|uniref:D-Ala-D-Ala carboxypeptidase family metallohydrolase n=1 Tax=Sphingomonas TaxID=13687 RepID=UPI000DEFB6DE|nr:MULTISPECIES: D-Ala-D-Ala carboxypeptidase family metallohydrolase [Sphingomonas]